MRKLALAVVAAATLLVGSVAPASAYWHHHGWGGPGIGPGLALGLFAGTLAAATAPPVYAPPVYYGPVYDPPPYYYGPPYRVLRYYRPAYPFWYGW